MIKRAAIEFGLGNTDPMAMEIDAAKLADCIVDMVGIPHWENAPGETDNVYAHTMLPDAPVLNPGAVIECRQMHSVKLTDEERNEWRRLWDDGMEPHEAAQRVLRAAGRAAGTE